MARVVGLPCIVVWNDPRLAVDAATSPFADDYRARLVTAAAAMRGVESGSTIAMGLSPCQPPALLRALADRARA